MKLTDLTKRDVRKLLNILESVLDEYRDDFFEKFNESDLDENKDCSNHKFCITYHLHRKICNIKYEEYLNEVCTIK